MERSTFPLHHWWEINVPRRTPRLWALVSIGYLLLALVWTWPLALHFGDAAIQGVAAVPETPVDIAQNSWNIWQFRLHWADGSWPLSTDRIFYPQRINLTFQTYGLPNLLVAAPIAALFDELTALNVLVFLGFVGGALAMYALLLAYGVDDWLAFGLGWLFVATPAHLSVVQTSGVERALMGWLLLVHWAVARAVRQPGWRSALWLAVVLVLVSLNSGYYGLYGLVYCVVMIALALSDTRVQIRWLSTTGWAVAGFAGWASVMATLMSWPQSGYLGQRELPGQSILTQSITLADWYERQTDLTHVLSLMDIIKPPSAHFFWRLIEAPLTYPHPGIGGYLGIGVVLLVCYICWYERRIRPMLVATAVLVWLACGPTVRLWDAQIDGQLPGLHALLNIVSVYRNATRPGMFLYYAWIPLILVLSVAVQRIAMRRTVWAGIVLVLLCVDFLPPQWGMVSMQPSLAVSRIPKNEPAGSVLEVPARMDEGQGLVDQMCHGRPIAAGYLARVPDFYVTPMHGIVVPPDATADVIPTLPLREMGNLGVRYLVVHSDAPYFVLDNLTKWNVPLLAKVQRERVFRVPPPDEAALVADNNWWDSEDNGTQRWRWSQAESRLILLSDRAKIVRISMTMSSSVEREGSWSLNGVPLFRISVPAQPAMLTRVVSFPIRAGVNYLDLSSPTTTDAFGRAVGIAFTRLEVSGSSEVIGAVPVHPPATERDTVFCP